MKLICSLLFLVVNFASGIGFTMNTGNSGSSVLMTSAPKNTTAALASSHHYKSFREWKASMIAAVLEKSNLSQQALTVKQRLSASATDPNTLRKTKSEAGLNSQLEELQQQAEKDRYQLSVTKDLTISDYFVGYLTVQKDLAATISEVSSRLSPDEVAELMHAYANNFFSSKPSTQPSAARAEANQ